MKIVLCAVFIALAVAIPAQESQEDIGMLDYWSNEFDYDDYAEQSNKDSSENLEAKAEDTRQIVDEILKVNDEPQGVQNKDDPFTDLLDDYQFEDNRSNADDKDAIKETDDVPNEEPIPDDAPEGFDNMDEPPFEPSREDNDLSDDSWESLFKDEVALPPKSDEWLNLLKDEIPEELPEPENENESLEETLDNMNEKDDNLDEGLADKSLSNELVEELPKTENENESLEEPLEDMNEGDDILDDIIAHKSLSNELPEQDPIDKPDLDQVIEETNKLLKESDDNFKEDDTNDVKPGEDGFFESKEEDETPEDVLNDLNDDLDKLLATLDKLSDNNSDLGNNEDNVEGIDSIDEVQDYEEKYNRPYKEGNILSLRDDLDNFDDSNLPDIFAENAENDDKDKESINESSFEDKIANIEDNNEAPTTKAVDQAEKSEIEEDSNEFDYSSEIDKLLSYVDNLESDETKKSELKHAYGDDGLENDQQPINEDAEIFSVSGGSLVTDTTTENAATNIDISAQNVTTEESPSTKLVDELNSSEYNELMAQFAFAHSEDLDVKSKKFAKNVAPIPITLSVDEPTVITSPGYPSFYEANTVTDWIIEGLGTGIEMNVTHLEMNGAFGDYLLVKPGGIDASGTDGLVFSFRLTSERRYRFTNVNRMFIRFESGPGMPFFNGFSLSARMIWPLPEIVPEEAPEPEAVLNPPQETLVLNLAGLTLREFEAVKPTFKELIADMAQEYIKDNEIDPGLNTTVDVTQVTRITICNIRWPNHETCVEVTFGVPLHYDVETEYPRLNSEDLDTMWRTYISKEPFATRLREMGITEYAIPNDSTVLMVWLVISAGVVISMAMLAFALWRFSCFEDYTRMRAHSDTDSIHNEKKNLDLYPTPHQTLPPLYSETDYKWADNQVNDSTRVDMGGFANRSYMRDNLFEFDSDEDIITPHDRRGTTISPRDVYEV